MEHEQLKYLFERNPTKYGFSNDTLFDDLTEHQVVQFEFKLQFEFAMLYVK